MTYCDLHVHSNYSDGTCTPAEVVALAKEANLTAVALCDHNTVSGLPEFLAAAAGSGVEGIPGTEFSTDYKGVELHILGLFIKPAHYAAVTQRAQRYLLDKEQSNIDLCSALCAAGLEIDYRQIKEKTVDGFVNRAVIGAELVRLGHADSVQQAFKTWLSPKRGYYIPPKRPDAFEIIRFIKSIGAVAVLAHPFLNLDQPELEEFLPQAVKAGLDGMEVYYSKYDEESTALSVELAEKYGLLPSGGSDFHGQNKPDIAIGVGRGNLRIPDSWKNALKAKIF